MGHLNVECLGLDGGFFPSKELVHGIGHRVFRFALYPGIERFGANPASGYGLAIPAGGRALTWRIIGNEKGRAAEWIWSRIPAMETRPDWGNFSALINEFDGCIRAVVIYNQFIPTNSIDMHIAAVDGGRWLTRPFLSAAFRYPFIELGLRRVTARVAADNHRIIRFIEHLGFVREGRARLGYSETVDCLIYGMLKRECRYIVETQGPDAARSNRDHCGAVAGQRTKPDAERRTEPDQSDRTGRLAHVLDNRLQSGRDSAIRARHPT